MSSTPPGRPWAGAGAAGGSRQRAPSPRPPPAGHTPSAGHLGHVLTAENFSREALYRIFYLAETYRTSVAKERPLDHVLKVGGGGRWAGGRAGRQGEERKERRVRW